MKINCHCCTLSVLLAGLLLSAPGHAAEPLPDSLVKSKKATEGSTDVATSGFEAAGKKPDSKDATELEISAGGLASAGNSRSIAATTAGKFRLRRGADQVGAGVAANYAESQVTKGEGLQTTVENFQGKVRYDRFLAGSFVVFGSVSARHDRFQGLDLRINLDPGFGYYFIDEEKQQLWLEAGYDFQHDIRRDEAIQDALAETISWARPKTVIARARSSATPVNSAIRSKSPPGSSIFRGSTRPPTTGSTGMGRSLRRSARAFQSRRQSACATITTRSRTSKTRTSSLRSASSITSSSHLL